jgi:hypothetical protein
MSSLLDRETKRERERERRGGEEPKWGFEIRPV